MTGMPPKLLTLVKPMLADFLYVCHQLPDAQRRQFEILNGVDAYDPERSALDLASRIGPKWAVVKQDGQPVAVGGLNMVIPGVWQDFLISTEECWQQYAKSVTRFVDDIAAQLLVSGEARRIQAVTLATNTQIRGWYELIGMNYEGTLRAYGAHGEDAVMYARTGESK